MPATENESDIVSFWKLPIEPYLGARSLKRQGPVIYLTGLFPVYDGRQGHLGLMVL